MTQHPRYGVLNWKLLRVMALGGLLLIGCTVPFCCPRGGSGSYRLSDVLAPLRRFRVIPPGQEEGLVFDVTLLDESRHPVPHAILVLKSEATSETLKADERGVLQLVITKARLTQNPQLIASKDGVPLAVRTTLSGELESGGKKPAAIELSGFQWLCGDSVAVLYRQSDSVIAESALAIIQTQRAYIRDQLPVPVIPWAVVLVDTPPPFILARTYLPYAGIEYHLSPYRAARWRQELYRNHFWRFVKHCLFAAVQCPVEEMAWWLFVGLPDYWQAQYLLEQRTAGSCPEGPLLYDDWPWLDSIFRMRRGKPLDLLRWKPQRTEDWILAQAFFRAFWCTVARDYGDSAIARYLHDLSVITAPTPETYQKTLIKHTGPEVAKLLRAFPADSAWRITADLHRALDGR